MAEERARGQLRADEARSNLEHMARLDIYCEPMAVRKTGIICTIGPVSQGVEQMLALMRAGMCIVRMNFSHGSHEARARSFNLFISIYIYLSPYL